MFYIINIIYLIFFLLGIYISIKENFFSLEFINNYWIILLLSIFFTIQIFFKSKISKLYDNSNNYTLKIVYTILFSMIILFVLIGSTSIISFNNFSESESILIASIIIIFLVFITFLIINEIFDQRYWKNKSISINNFLSRYSLSVKFILIILSYIPLNKNN